MISKVVPRCNKLHFPVNWFITRFMGFFIPHEKYIIFF